MENKWRGLEGNNYAIEDLGRPKVFYLPSHKLKTIIGGKTVEDILHSFLIEHFGGFTTTLIPYFGIWRANGQHLVYDECRMYEVSFLGKKGFPSFLQNCQRSRRR